MRSQKKGFNAVFGNVQNRTSRDEMFFFFFCRKECRTKWLGQSFDYAKTLPIAKGFSTQVRLHGLETCTCICINSNSLDYAKRRL